MRLLALLSLAIAFLSQVSSASPKSDSIVAFTGSHTKIVWLRYAFRNADYSAMSQTAATATGEQAMLFDTDEGQERVLGAGLTTSSACMVSNCQVQDNVRISRSGRWATVADLSSTYIFDLTGTSGNKRVLLSQSNCTYWCVKAWGRDAATGNEYVYTLDNFNSGTGTYLGTAIYKILVKPDGTADVANAVKIPIAGNLKIDGALSVSSDLKKIGGEFPWPTKPGILDVGLGTIADRKVGAACHTNIAADDSYRFFHLDEDHIGVYIWGAAMSTTNRYISLGTNMVNSLKGAFWCPRWSNNPQFMATTYPADDLGDNVDALWGMSVAANKALKLGETVQFCVLHKFSSDFQSIEKSMAAIADTRSFNFLPDVWMASGYTGGAIVSARTAQPRSGITSGMQTVGSGDLVRISHMAAGTSVRLIDAQGRVMCKTVDAGSSSIDVRGMNPGTYVVSAVSGAGIESQRMVSIVR